MVKEKIKSLEEYFDYVKAVGKLRTEDHAVRWSNATLQILGLNVSGRIKRGLRNKLPKQLSDQLGFVFMPVFFRDQNIEAREFCNFVARRSRAASDPDFARLPVAAVFGGLKALLDDDDFSEKIQEDLSPELSKMWEKA